MTKLARSFALMVALAGLTGGAVTLAAAQDKDAQKATRDDRKEGDTVGMIEVYKGKTGYRYRVKNAAGKTVAMPLPQASWQTRDECLKAIEDLKVTLEKGKIVDAKN